MSMAGSVAGRMAPGTVAGRLERLPLSRFHRTVFIVIGLAMLFDGYDLNITGVVIPSLRQIGWLDAARTPVFISLPLLAAALGSVAAGVLGDRFGRRLMFRINVLVYSLGSFCCALAPNWEVLLLLRTVTMFAIGTQIVTGYAYMNELTPGALRGRFQSGVALLVNSGLPIGALMAWALVPNLHIDTGWRALFGVAVVPAVLVFVAQGILPESPRWLVSVGREREAEAIVAGLEARCAAAGQAMPPVPALPPPARNLGWGALTGPRFRGRFLLCVVFNLCHLVAIFVLGSWLPSLLVARGLTMGNAFSTTAISYAGGFLGPLIGLFIADRVERRTQVVVAALVCAASGLAYSLESSPVVIALTGLVMLSGIFFISSVGFATYLPEILPTGVRLRGMGAAAFAGRLAAAASPFAVAWVVRELADPFVVVAAVGALYVLLAATVGGAGPRTSGRALEVLENEAR